MTSAAINYSDQASPCPFSTFHRLYMCKLKEETDWKEYIGVSGSTYHPLVYAKALSSDIQTHTLPTHHRRSREGVDLSRGEGEDMEGDGGGAISRFESHQKTFWSTL